jgi:hypothetical protein
MGPGLAGQLFVFDQYDQPAILNGSITVDLFDETKRPPGVQPNKPERWRFNKDVVKALRSVDERFGPNYVLFLPWPAYRPDVTRVRITVLYDPENGSYPIRALETKLSLDPTLARTPETGASEIRTPPPPGALPGSLTGSAGTAAPTSAAAGGRNASGPGMGVMTLSRTGARPSTAGAAGETSPAAPGPMRP